MKIYTKTGDSGETSLYGGRRVSKNSLRVSAYGLIDELNSLLGIVLAKLDDKRVKDFINPIQKDLFQISGNLAGAKGELDGIGKRTQEMEKMIDSLEKELPQIKNFILPQGTEASAFLFFARAVARRAEREIVTLHKEEEVDARILVYCNRLSDLLFTLARYINYRAGITETIIHG